MRGIDPKLHNKSKGYERNRPKSAQKGQENNNPLKHTISLKA